MAKINISDPIKAFQFTLQTLYDVEKQLEQTLPKLSKAATSEELAETFKEHLEETKNHSKRLEEVFKMLGEKAQRKPGEAIKGLIADGRMIISSDAPEGLKDALLAGAGRDVENYEMAMYMNAIEEAKGLDLKDAADLLEDTLDEEKEADKLLAAIMKDCLDEVKDSVTVEEESGSNWL